MAVVAIRNVLVALGAAAVAMSASVHLHLWLHGYSGIATIGPLFLLQAITGYAPAVAILVLRRPVIELLGAGYLLATMGGFLISVDVGPFGSQDTWSASLAPPSFAAEAPGAVLLLAAAAAAPRTARGGGNQPPAATYAAAPALASAAWAAARRASGTRKGEHET